MLTHSGRFELETGTSELLRLQTIPGNAALLGVRVRDTNPPKALEVGEFHVLSVGLKDGLKFWLQ